MVQLKLGWRLLACGYRLASSRLAVACDAVLVAVASSSCGTAASVVRPAASLADVGSDHSTSRWITAANAATVRGSLILPVSLIVPLILGCHIIPSRRCRSPHYRHHLSCGASCPPHNWRTKQALCYLVQEFAYPPCLLTHALGSRRSGASRASVSRGSFTPAARYCMLMR